MERSPIANSQEINQIGYDALADSWKEIRDKSFVTKLIQDLVEVLPVNATILDIGCGTGHPIASYLSNQGYQITGINASQKMIDHAKNLHLPNASFHKVDFFDFETSQTFDAIIAWDSLWHLPYERQLDIYAKIVALLNAGGYFIFSAGDADDHHVNDHMGVPIYHAARPKELIWKVLNDLGIKILYTFLDYREQGSDRGMVMLVRKD